MSNCKYRYTVICGWLLLVYNTIVISVFTCVTKICVYVMKIFVQIIKLTCFVQTGLDGVDGDLPVGEERHVPLDHQHELLGVAVLEHKHQVLR